MVKNKWIARFRDTVSKWQEHDCATLAAATSYYAVFSLFPLLLLGLTALGFALRFSSGAQNARQQLLELVAKNASPLVEQHVEEILTQISGRAAVSGPVGLAILLLAAIGVFGQLEHAFNRIWHVPAGESHGFFRAILNALFYRLRAFLILLGMGVLMFAAFAMGVAASALRTFAVDLPGGGRMWSLTQVVMSIALFWLSFTLLYKIVPKARVRWSEALQGGLLAALLWEGARQALTFFLVGERYNAYGIVGSLIALMLWIYIASSVLFLGAEFARASRSNRFE